MCCEHNVSDDRMCCEHNVRDDRFEYNVMKRCMSHFRISKFSSVLINFISEH